jgi:prophage regulatory protein
MMTTTLIQTSQNPTPNDRVLRWPELKERIGLSRSHVHSLISRGTFPKQIKLGDRASGWLDSEISDWLEQRITESKSNNSNPTL